MGVLSLRLGVRLRRSHLGEAVGAGGEDKFRAGLGAACLTGREAIRHLRGLLAVCRSFAAVRGRGHFTVRAIRGRGGFPAAGLLAIRHFRRGFPVSRGIAAVRALRRGLAIGGRGTAVRQFPVLRRLHTALAAAPLQAQQQNTDPITYTDLYEWGLSGSANASERRRTFLRILGLPPRLSKKEIIQVLNTLYTRAALQVQLQAMK